MYSFLRKKQLCLLQEPFTVISLPSCLVGRVTACRWHLCLWMEQMQDLGILPQPVYQGHRAQEDLIKAGQTEVCHCLDLSGMESNL